MLRLAGCSKVFRGVQAEGKHLEAGRRVENNGLQAVGAEVFRCLGYLGGWLANEMTQRNPDAFACY
jgi:hypothetical protein